MKLFKLFSRERKTDFQSVNIEDRKDVVMKEDNAILLDTILLILVAKEGEKLNIHKLHLEIARCGFFISHPDLKIALNFLHKEGMITDTSLFTPEFQN